ncbi:MAG: hypothetical protein Q8896_08520 [Bacteroidota bacterium]|nr:hypothetical protein [Bacteroidota bacterium]MDP4236385.1 hypothetical protein [Bacteroidota bacterium]
MLVSYPQLVGLPNNALDEIRSGKPGSISRAVDSTYLHILPCTDTFSLAGHWGGYLLSFERNYKCLLDFSIIPNKEFSEIHGQCTIHFPHFQPVDIDQRDYEITDSIWKNGDRVQWKKRVEEQHKQDSIEYRSYMESYGFSGVVSGDSITIQIDTIYPTQNRLTSKVQLVARERHLRFRGKWMKWYTSDSASNPHYFMPGTCLDSAFQQIPLFGPFVIYKQ